VAERPIRVVIANDDRIVVEGLRSMLTSFGDRVTVIDTAAGDPEIRHAVDADADADVMLIDAFGRVAGGIDAAIKVLATSPPFAVAVFTDAEDLRLVLQALRAGVHGYLLKSLEPEELVDALVALGGGEIVIDHRLAVEATVLAARTIAIGDWPGAHLGLTRREAELLNLLGQGATPRQVADDLQLSPQTVRTHIRNLYRKIDVNDRAGAVAVAWREGLVRE
jgi:DNA-binding NarL/FixJ family response regulator